MRYTGEVKFRLIGPREQCTLYIPQARVVLGKAWNIHRDLGGIDTAVRREILPNGVKISAYIYDPESPPILVIDVTEVTGGDELLEQYHVRSVWEPEGIVLTPTTNANRDGWGLPSRLADKTAALLDSVTYPLGLVEAGSTPQVILNRFENNKYLDKAEFITNAPDGLLAGDTGNNKLATSYDTQSATNVTYESWYTYAGAYSFATPDPDTGEYVDGYYEGPTYWGENPDTRVAGIYIVRSVDGGTDLDLKLAQYDELGVANYFEAIAADVQDPDTGADTQQWFCHRPEELLYGSMVFEDIFAYTNDLRIVASEEPVYRQVRGDGNAAHMAAHENNASGGYFYHSAPEFRVGYRTTGGRVVNAAGRDPWTSFAHNLRENLALLISVPDDATSVGDYVASLWEGSPVHYANMVDSMWTDFSFPYFSQFNGSKGAAHHIGASGSADYLFRDEYGSDPTTDNRAGIDPPVLGATCFAQEFITKEAWLPIYDLLHEGLHGAAGTFNGSNPYSHANFTQSRRFGQGRSIYEIPGGLVPTQFFNDAPAADDFLSGIGAAVFDLAGEKWVRAVYWRSDTVTIAQQPGFGTYPPEGDHVTMTVVKFPLRIMETSQMPWRDDIPGVWEIEWERAFLLADGWLTNPPGKVVFNSTGEKFTFTMHKITDTYTDALDYIATQWTTGRSPLPKPRAAIESRHFEYDASQVATFDYQLDEYVPNSLVAAVTCWTGDPDPLATYHDKEITRYYRRELKGTYDMFPHYNAADVLSYITLDIDEFSEQRGNGGDPNDPTDTYPGDVSFCWRVRKMVFPSGKEFTYMQQYMHEQLTALPWDPDDLADPNYRSWPGTGEASFYCVIDYLDELHEDIIFSKIVTEKEHWEFNSTPYYRINGDITWELDLNPKPAPEDVDAPPRVQEVLYTLAKDNTVTGGQPALNAEDVSAQDFYPNLPDTRWVYSMDVTTTFYVNVDDTFGAPPGMLFADTAGTTIPDIETTMTFLGAADPGTYVRPAYNAHPEAVVDAPWNRQPFEDYTVSAYTGYQYFGESNHWTFGTGKKELSFMNCNIAPMFAKPFEVDAKLVRYDGRIIARVGIRHVHKVGHLPPPGLRPESNPFLWAEWTAYAPPEDAEVLLWANFDIDAAVGISDVRDIWPMGKII